MGTIEKFNETTLIGCTFRKFSAFDDLICRSAVMQWLCEAAQFVSGLFND